MQTQEEQVRQRRIHDLIMKYGKTRLKQRGSNLVLRQVSEKDGRMILKMPISLLPATWMETYHDVFEGMVLSELTEQVLPMYKHLTNVGFCKEFHIILDASTKQKVAELTFCVPEEAKYLLFMVRQTVGSEQQHEVLSVRNLLKPYLVWDSYRYTNSDSQRYYVDYWLVEKALLQNAGVQVPAVLGDAGTRLKSEDYLVEAQGENLRITSNCYADEFSGQQCWVIDPRGRLLRPNKVDDKVSRFIADAAAVEVWEQVSPDCLVIHWMRTRFDGDDICTVLHRPECGTSDQAERVRYIAATITDDWRKRKDPSSGRHPESNCFWKLSDDAPAADKAPPSVDPSCPW